MVARKPIKRDSRKVADKKEKITKLATATKPIKEPVSSCYCRRCEKIYPANKFFAATDLVLDKNGFMSVCKDCIAEIYLKIFQTEGTLQKTMLRLCRMINWSYTEAAIQATERQLESRGRTPDDISAPGIYKTKIVSTGRSVKGSGGVETIDMTFSEPTSLIEVTDPLLDEDDNADTLKQKWGDGMSYSDYVFLEKKLSEWKRDYSCQNKAELFFMKELSFKELELQKARVEGRSVDTILKSMDTLLKSSALTPAQNNASLAGKSQDTWSLLIKTVEQTEPAEFYADKNLFADYDNIGAYITNYIKRPIMNFIGAGKSFELTDDDEGTVELEEDREKEPETKDSGEL